MEKVMAACHWQFLVDEANIQVFVNAFSYLASLMTDAGSTHYHFLLLLTFDMFSVIA
jgi:hypothetical protein